MRGRQPAPGSPSRRLDVRVCFFGDSFTAGVGDEQALGWVGRLVAGVRPRGVALTAYGLGVRRQTSPEIAARVEAEASPRLRDGDAHGVVYAAGTNDTTLDGDRQRAEPEASVAALDRVADLCAARGWALLVVGPAPVGDRSQNARIVGLSAALGGRCAARATPYAEVARLLADDPAWLAEVAQVDGAHPRSTGYARLAGLIEPAFTDWLAELAAQSQLR